MTKSRITLTILRKKFRLKLSPSQGKLIQNVLRDYGTNQLRLAKILGISRPHMTILLHKSKEYPSASLSPTHARTIYETIHQDKRLNFLQEFVALYNSLETLVAAYEKAKPKEREHILSHLEQIAHNNLRYKID